MERAHIIAQHPRAVTPCYRREGAGMRLDTARAVSTFPHVQVPRRRTA